MSESNLEFGPLASLIGTWEGTKGHDVSPEKVGEEINKYSEKLVIEAVGGATNAEEQKLMVVRYHQQVTRISDGNGIHDEIGYWIWNKADNSVALSLSIPRGLTLLANTTNLEYIENTLDLKVVAEAGAKNWGIVQSPFMEEKAKTVRFEREISTNGNILSYKQLMVLEIYGKTFDHTDENSLEKVC